MKNHRVGWGCIYSVINLINAKEYVGKDQTGDPENHRWKHHCKMATTAHPKSYFHRAIKVAGGPSKFKWMVIWRGPVAALNAKEIYYIAKRHTYVKDFLGGGYNLTHGGEGVSGFKFSRKSKDKIRKSAVLRFQEQTAHDAASAAQRLSYASNLNRVDNIREGLRRYWLKPSSHKKASELQRRIWADPMRRAKQRAASLRAYEDPAVKRKLSRAVKRTCSTPEARQRNSAAQQRRWKRPEEHEKSSAGQRRRYADPVQRQRVSDALIEAFKNPVLRQK